MEIKYFLLQLYIHSKKNGLQMDKLMQVLSNFTHVATACYGLIDMKIAIKIPA